MEYAYSILMFCLAGLLLLYAGAVYRSKSDELIMRSYAVKMKDKEKYARQFSKVLALVALSPALSALVGLFVQGVVPVVVLIVSFILLIRRGARWMDGA